jgi:hypothetical protein
MEPKDYNAIMQQMLSYANNTGASSLDFNTYSKLYYKLKAILEFTEGVSATGSTWIVDSSFQADLMEVVQRSKQDSDYKLDPAFARRLNQFVRQSGFVYTEPANTEYDMSKILETMKYLAGMGTYNIK